MLKRCLSRRRLQNAANDLLYYHQRDESALSVGSTQMAIAPATWISLMVLACSGVTRITRAADECDGFSWDVRQERAVFASAAQSLSAGITLAAAPELSTNQLYQLSLSPQEQVTFVLAPGKKMLADGAYAGVAHVHIAQSGTYRVALNQGFWVDLIVSDKLIGSSDFTGQPHCDAPRKIVQFLLPAGDLVLQLSGATAAQVRVAIVPAPAAQSQTAPMQPMH